MGRRLESARGRERIGAAGGPTTTSQPKMLSGGKIRNVPLSGKDRQNPETLQGHFSIQDSGGKDETGLEEEITPSG